MKTNKLKMGIHSQEKRFRLAAFVISAVFAVLMLYPLIFTVSSSMKDNAKIYEVPPRLLPDQAVSLSVTVDYTGMDFAAEEELKDAMLQDSVLAMFGINYKFPKDSIMEVRVYGIKDGKTLFYSRGHQIKLQMERDYGVYSSAAVKREVLLHKDRYQRAMESVGYQFNPMGLDKKMPKETDTVYQGKVKEVLDEKYHLNGNLTAVSTKENNLLIMESFRYYLQMPGYIYPKSERIAKLGFLTFVFNSIIVIGFAIIAQVLLCSVCAFVISRLLSERAGKAVLLFFMGAMMVPFASIMLPQLIMYRQMGAYNNYAALLLPFLYPYGFYVYLYKGFFDKIPGSYFEAARLDGAGNLYLYRHICMPLSKPIISLIALQTFIGNWNDFFWAWLVTEDQKLWTLNVALFNISNNVGTKQNAIMGLAIVTITPVILLSILFSKQLKQSIVASGVKG